MHINWSEVDFHPAQSDLPKFTHLARFLENHIVDGFYVLQFRKCSDPTCCHTKDILPPHVPAWAV